MGRIREIEPGMHLDRNGKVWASVQDFNAYNEWALSRPEDRPEKPPCKPLPGRYTDPVKAAQLRAAAAKNKSKGKKKAAKG